MEQSDEVMVVRFDRQGALNALNQKMIVELTEVAKLLAEDLTIKSVVLTGASTAFSSGVDLKDAQNWDLEEMTDTEIRRLFYRGVRLCQAWEDLPQITIAAAEGMMVGGGCALGRVRGQPRRLRLPGQRSAHARAAPPLGARVPTGRR